MKQLALSVHTVYFAQSSIKHRANQPPQQGSLARSGRNSSSFLRISTCSWNYHCNSILWSHLQAPKYLFKATAFEASHACFCAEYQWISEEETWLLKASRTKINGCGAWEFLGTGVIAATIKRLYSSDTGLKQAKMDKVGAGSEWFNMPCVSCPAQALWRWEFIRNKDWGIL